jgi:NADH-quinone oxidoreductase subunit L
MIYQLIVFLPLLGAIIAGLFGRWIGARPSEIITTLLVAIPAVLSWIVLFQLGWGGTPAKVYVMRWITSGALEASWSLRIDTLTAVMLVVVTTVSSLVHAYSIGYMAHDDSRPRFFSYLSLFTFAMLMLVTSDNLVQLFFGWEGVGLMSYLLIGFWYLKPEANAAAIKAFIVNRVGDFGFALGICGIFLIFQTLQFDPIFAAAPAMEGKTLRFLSWDVDVLTALSLLLFIGAMGKSAQFLLHTWLPDAMEGPTPVSALIHAATMVTAGVFMVARMSPLFEYAPQALAFVTLIGATTAFFAATVGCAQNDIKRVIAYSTCSQLGYMFVAMGVGAYGVGMFHLFTHAFFKALLFLAAGSVIHALHDEQDIRRMGGLRSKIPITWALMLIGTLALTGFPLTAGYYSKDAIVEAAYAGHNQFAAYAFWMTVVAALLTSFYSWRLMFLTFHGETRADHHAFEEAHESPPVMTVPMAVLALGSLAAGIAFAPFFIGEGYKAFWGASLFEGASNHVMHAMHDVPRWVALAPTVAMVAGFAIAWLFYVRAPWLPEATAKSFRPLYLFLLNKWYFDEIYDWLFVRPTKRLARFLWKYGDGAVIDGTIDGIAARVLDVTGRVVRFQSGYLYQYAFVMLIGVAILITLFMFTGGEPL